MRLRGHLLPFVLFAISASLAQSNPALFAPAVAYSSDGYAPQFVAVSDVNGDGNPDIVVVNFNGCTVDISNNCHDDLVAVLLGNGDGTFQTAVLYSSGGQGTTSLAVSDVNRDGKPDIVVANQCVGSNCATGSVAVLLGNGDGTFQTAINYGSGGQNATSMAVSDVNQDGKPDIMIATVCVSTCTTPIVAVLLGNGDGTFQTAVTYGSGGYGPDSLAVADMNGDGKPDIVVANCGASIGNCTTGIVAVLWGNGDGTFQTAVPYGSGGYGALSVAVSDVNRDGKMDIVVANGCIDSSTICATATVDVLLGNGDGTFQTAVTYGSGGQVANSVSVADVNGDGKPDIVVANQCAINHYCSGIVGVLLGNGDGSFQTLQAYGLGGYNFVYVAMAVADVNGDSKPDVIVANSKCGDSCSSLEGVVSVLINTAPPPYKAFVEPPINSDKSSIFKANRGVIPVKFSLTQNNAVTCQLPQATISVNRTAGGVLGSVDESTYSMAADNGSNFRIDSSACQYVYNLAASALGVGAYQVDIRIDGTVVGKAVFALK